MNTNEKILKIMSLALEISPSDKLYNYEDKPLVFVRYSPHCASLSISIHLHGWKDHVSSDEDYSISISRHPEKLDTIINRLEQIKEFC